jgi:hypothetical protein
LVELGFDFLSPIGPFVQVDVEDVGEHITIEVDVFILYTFCNFISKGLNIYYYILYE